MTEGEQKPPESPRPALTPEGKNWFDLAVGTYTQLTAALKHHINNPVSALRGNLQLLEYDLADQAKLGEGTEVIRVFEGRLGRIKVGVEKIATVTAHLGALAGEACDRERYQFEELSGQSFISSLGNFLEEFEGMEIVTVSSSLSDEKLLADPWRLSVAITQLLQNSLDAGASEIKIDLKNNEGKLEIEITDNGSGLDLKGKPLFGLNSSTKSVGGVTNALSQGLFIAKTVVLAHGGEIDVRDREDGQKGVVAKIGLPLVK